jgi:hypothetical protein
LPSVVSFDSREFDKAGINAAVLRFVIAKVMPPLLFLLHGGIHIAKLPRIARQNVPDRSSGGQTVDMIAQAAITICRDRRLARKSQDFANGANRGEKSQFV